MLILNRFGFINQNFMMLNNANICIESYFKPYSNDLKKNTPKIKSKQSQYD